MSDSFDLSGWSDDGPHQSLQTDVTEALDSSTARSFETSFGSRFTHTNGSRDTRANNEICASGPQCVEQRSPADRRTRPVLLGSLPPISEMLQTATWALHASARIEDEASRILQQATAVTFAKPESLASSMNSASCGEGSASPSSKESVPRSISPSLPSTASMNLFSSSSPALSESSASSSSSGPISISSPPVSSPPELNPAQNPAQIQRARSFFRAMQSMRAVRVAWQKRVGPLRVMYGRAMHVHLGSGPPHARRRRLPTRDAPVRALEFHEWRLQATALCKLMLNAAYGSVK